MNSLDSLPVDSRSAVASSTVPSRSRINFLDVLRVFAFSSVLVGHKFINDLSALVSDPTCHRTLRAAAEYLLPLCEGGAAGVVVFFLVSGYVITHVLQRESAGVFAFRRVFRIYPLYCVAVLLEIALAKWVFKISVPPAATLVPRLLLIGDFCDTPYALAGVEWTLRIEVLFYALMAIFKAVGLFSRPHWMLGAFAVGTALLHVAEPFPTVADWSDGYLTLYGPFLFLGSAFYWLEKKRVRVGSLFGLTVLVLGAYLVAIPKLHANWKESNAVALALALFLVVWLIRERVHGNFWLVQLSNLTYAVYLFHNWMWFYLERLVARIGLSFIPPRVQVVLLLLALCWFMYNTVEKGGIRLGRDVMPRILSLWNRWFRRIPEAPTVALPTLGACNTRSIAPNQQRRDDE